LWKGKWGTRKKTKVVEGEALARNAMKKEEEREQSVTEEE
jgi:hypothetical protein